MNAAQTVIDLDDASAEGTGLMFPPTAEGLRDGLERALKLYADPARLAAAQARGMRRDFSWARAARAYEHLYEEAL